MRRLRELVADGLIGDLREIQSNFHFVMAQRDTNIRMSAKLAGRALLDVGCYRSGSPATCSPPSTPVPGRPPTTTPAAST